MKSALISLHLLPHLPPSRRVVWATGQLGRNAAQADDLVAALKHAYPYYSGSLEPVRQMLSGDLSQLEQATVTIRELHASSAPEPQRPLPGRGCRYCQAPCQYGHMMTQAMRGQEGQVGEFLKAAPGSPAQQMLTLSNKLVQVAMNNPELRFDGRMNADMAYCLATQIAGMRVGQQRLAALELLQQRLDIVRGKK